MRASTLCFNCLISNLSFTLRLFICAATCLAAWLLRSIKNLSSELFFFNLTSSSSACLLRFIFCSNNLFDLLLHFFNLVHCSSTFVIDELHKLFLSTRGFPINAFISAIPCSKLSEPLASLACFS